MCTKCMGMLPDGEKTDTVLLQWLRVPVPARLVLWPGCQAVRCVPCRLRF